MSAAAPPPPPKTVMPGHLDQQHDQHHHHHHHHHHLHQLQPDSHHPHLHQQTQQRSVLRRAREQPASTPPSHPRAHVTHTARIPDADHNVSGAAPTQVGGTIISHDQELAHRDLQPTQQPSTTGIPADSTATATGEAASQPRSHSPVPVPGKGALLSRLRRTLVSREPLARTWEKASFTEECRSAPAMLYGGGPETEHGAGGPIPGTRGTPGAEVLAERGERATSREGG